MQLQPGARLGSYEILGDLGAGGMGEVVRARDTRLHRDVAIKILPALFASDPERLARFEREATTLASLNHPNIAQIYGLEDVPGAAAAGRALVMELVEGETLAERIARGPIPVDETLPIARQILDALEGAHDCGIVHRDLKPANIKVRPDGTVKVLDFGLAKALDPVAHSSGAAPLSSPTMTSPAVTRAGVIIGTAAYMSPEQARGRSVDARTDIWAFGVTLYEMLVGKPLFAGGTVSDVLASILRDGPEWTALPADTPSSLRTLLKRCLQKDPQLRLRHAADARLELMDVDAAAADQSSVRRGGRSWTTIGALGITLLALALIPVLTPTASDSVNLPVRKWIIPQESGEQFFGFENVPAISPDGSRVAYTDGTHLRIRDLSSLDSVDVSGRGFAGMPTWSPDGSFVAYFIDHKTLWKVAVGGGAPVKICDLPTGVVFGLAWRPDRTLVVNVAYGPTAGELFKVPETGGVPERLTPAGGNSAPVFYVRGLPDGSLTYLRRRDGRIETVVERDNKQIQVLELGWHFGASYAPSGHLVYAGREPPGVWAVPFNLQSGSRTGAPFRIAAAGSGPNASRDGTLVYGRAAGGLLQLTWFNRDGSTGATLGQPQENMHAPAISPDGTRVAVVGVENGVRNIWIHEIGRPTKSRVTFGTDDVDPVWHPRDGRIVFQNGNWDIAAVTGDGGEPKAVLTTPVPEFGATWSTDGRHLVFVRFSPDKQADIWTIEDGKAPRPIVQERFSEMMPTLSPDGRFIAYASDETGRLEIFARAFPGGEGKRQVSSNGGTAPKWRGGEIYFVEGVTLMAAAVRTSPSLEIDAAKPLFKLEERGALVSIYDTLDGKRFVVARTVKPPRNGIAIIQNWIAEFRR
jgi:serine/threonine protein kinase